MICCGASAVGTGGFFHIAAAVALRTGFRVFPVVQTDVRLISSNFCAGNFLNNYIFVFAWHVDKAVFPVTVNFLDLFARNAGRFCNRCDNMIGCNALMTSDAEAETGIALRRGWQ